MSKLLPLSTSSELLPSDCQVKLAMYMDYRIDIVVLKNTPKREYYTHVEKVQSPGAPEESTGSAFRRWLQNPEEKFLILYEARSMVGRLHSIRLNIFVSTDHVAEVALLDYADEKRFYIISETTDDGCVAALYLENGHRMIERARGKHHVRAVERLRERVSRKVGGR
jgi:hypothetical protein